MGLYSLDFDASGHVSNVHWLASIAVSALSWTIGFDIRSPDYVAWYHYGGEVFRMMKDKEVVKGSDANIEGSRV